MLKRSANRTQRDDFAYCSPSGDEDDLPRSLPDPKALDALLLEQLPAKIRVEEKLLRVDRAAKDFKVSARRDRNEASDDD